MARLRRRRTTRPVETTRLAERDSQPDVQMVSWNGLTWVNIEHPTTRETDYLAQHYPFHRLDLDDCLSRIQRPKIDEYPDYFFMVFHFPVFNKEARVTTPSQVSVFISDDYLVTLHQGDLKPLVKLFRECQLEESTRQEVLGSGPGYLLYQLIDRLVDYCLPILNKIGENIERVEDEIFARSMPRAIREISELRRDVISFRRIIWPMRAVIGSLKSRMARFTTADLDVYYDDLLDHVDRIWDGLDEYKEVIEGLNDTHDSLASNHMNELLRVLTILATIGTVLTVVASFYGMNVPLPGGSNPGGSPHSWWILLLVMLAMMVAMLLYFRRKHWL